MKLLSNSFIVITLFAALVASCDQNKSASEDIAPAPTVAPPSNVAGQGTKAVSPNALDLLKLAKATDKPSETDEAAETEGEYDPFQWVLPNGQLNDGSVDVANMGIPQNVYQGPQPLIPGGRVGPRAPVGKVIRPGAPFIGRPNDLDIRLLTVLQQQQVRPINANSFLNPKNSKEFELGRILFNDNVLSWGNNISCSTCHLPNKGTSDGLSLTPTLAARLNPSAPKNVTSVLGRNVPTLYNRGHISSSRLFWDSRVEAISTGSGFTINTPAGAKLPTGLSGVLAAQALFPLANKDEMLGEQAWQATGGDFTAIWNGILQRVMARPDLNAKMVEVYGANPTIAGVANALAAYQSVAFRAINSPFDQYIAGRNVNAMSQSQKEGAYLFYGKANCSSCHAGALQTDNRHHNTVIPQFGPGAGDGYQGREDYGRGRITGRAEDKWAFRTPTLRNLKFAYPHMHNGSFKTMSAAVGHYSNPMDSMARWDNTQVLLPPGIAPVSLQGFFAATGKVRSELLNSRLTFPAVPLTNDDVRYITDFVENALYDPTIGGVPVTQ